MERIANDILLCRALMAPSPKFAGSRQYLPDLRSLSIDGVPIVVDALVAPPHFCCVFRV